MPRLCPACNTMHDGWAKCPADATIIVIGGARASIAGAVATTRVGPAPCQECANKDARLAVMLAEIERLTANKLTPVSNPANTPANGSTDRKAYQRDLMRRKRAEAKAAKNG